MQQTSKVKSMRTITTVLLLLLVMMIPIGISAQNVTIKGIVKDKTGETVIGASVVQKAITVMVPLLILTENSPLLFRLTGH